VRWQRTYRDSKGNMSVLSLSQDMALEDNIHYSIERPTQFTWKLRIRAIQVTDEGQYQCFVLTTLNSRARDERYITVVREYLRYILLQFFCSIVPLRIECRKSNLKLRLLCHVIRRYKSTWPSSGSCWKLPRIKMFQGVLTLVQDTGELNVR